MNLAQNTFGSLEDDLRKVRHKLYREMFREDIKGSFLIKIKCKVQEILGSDLAKCYQLIPTPEQFFSLQVEDPELDMCRHIVGLHRSNMVFLTTEERSKMERDKEYQNKLSNEVVEHIRLRAYGSGFFRSKLPYKGDNFLWFHVPYDLFVMCVRINELLQKKPNCENGCVKFFSDIANKALSVLTLLESGFFDTAYPICRGILECFVRVLAFGGNEEVIRQYFKFSKFEMLKTCYDREEKEFEELYKGRINKKSRRDKTDFLHYGWVDIIKDYHQLVPNNPYSFYGLLDYIRKDISLQDIEKNIADCWTQSINDIQQYYKMCHGYTHGSIGNCKYPLLHYFEISYILWLVVPHIYEEVCILYNENANIEDIDLLSKIGKDFAETLFPQYENRSTENLEAYYRKK